MGTDRLGLRMCAGVCPPAEIKRPLGGTMRGVGCLKLGYFAFDRSGTERAMLKTQGLRIAQSSRVALRHNGTQ